LQHTDQTSLVARLIQAELDEKHAQLLAHRRVTFADSATVAFRREVFRAAGGFRDALRAFEDTELAFRLSAQGHRLVVEPAAVVSHRHLESLVGYARRKFRIGYWGAAVYLAHPEKVTDDTRTPWSMRTQLLLAPLALLGLIAAPLSTTARLLAAGSGLSFLATTAPFRPWSRRHGADATLAAPLFLFLRALALCAGLTAGLASYATHHHEALLTPGSIEPTTPPNARTPTPEFGAGAPSEARRRLGPYPHSPPRSASRPP